MHPTWAPDHRSMRAVPPPAAPRTRPRGGQADLVARRCSADADADRTEHRVQLAM